ncbi:MAG: hypothetical protein KKA67_14970 [Spirochaetes bacterium]|nr:hypothetical protein [Spirochaetota bacterium]MBU1080302.1 hypothetical protein [Spirochaetota bacterium]
MIGFFFKDRNNEALPVSLRKRIPMLVYADMIMFVYFIAATFLKNDGDLMVDKAFSIAVLSTNVIFPVSLLLVRLGRYAASSWLASLGMLCNVIWIGILLPITDSADVYRFAVYLLASGVANNLVSLSKKQVVAYSIVGVAAFVACLSLIYVPALPDQAVELRKTTATMLLLCIGADLCLVLGDRLAIGLVAIAEDGLSANRRRADALSGALQRASENLAVGGELVGAVEGATADGAAVRGSIDSIRRDSEGLAAEAKAVDAAFAGIVKRADAMRVGVTNQNASLSATHTAIAEILSTISSLSEIAQARKTALDAAVSGLSEQHGKARAVADGIASIGEASRNVLGVASGIMDISEKTNMLAMNASIEAAHSGAAGKGFAVIAQEIRKLSEESRGNTASIAAALSRNGEVVDAAAKQIERFVSELNDLNRSVAGALHAMGEIIDGLGDVSAGTKKVSQATFEMVGGSKAVSGDVIGLSGEIRESGGSVGSITAFAARLEAEVAKTADSYSSIELALERVAAIGKANVDHVTSLGDELKAIQETS